MLWTTIKGFFKSRDKCTSIRITYLRIQSGPGTLLEKRMTRGDWGINPFGFGVLQTRNNLFMKRKILWNVADKILAEKAWKRITATDLTLEERAAATLLFGRLWKIWKMKIGMGFKTKRNQWKSEPTRFTYQVNVKPEIFYRKYTFIAMIKNISFDVLPIGSYTFFLPVWQFVDATPKKLLFFEPKQSSNHFRTSS